MYKQFKFEAVTTLLLRNRQQGIRAGSELLFDRDTALSLVDEMADLGVKCLGVTGWYKVAENQPWLAEDMSADYSVPRDVLQLPDAVEQSAKLVKAFIQDGLLERDIYVLLTFDYPAEWDKAIEKAWDAEPGPTYP